MDGPSRLDIFALYLAKCLRMASFGAISTVIFLYLKTNAHLKAREVGVLFSCALLGDILTTLPLTTQADRIGRKRILQLGAVLKIFSGVMLVTCSHSFLLMTLAVFLGVISISGNEIGPFQAIEQSSLIAGTREPTEIARFYSLYTFIGYFSQAMGALLTGFVVDQVAPSKETGYQWCMISFGFVGMILLGLYSLLSSGIEATPYPSSSSSKAAETQPLVAQHEKNQAAGPSPSSSRMLRMTGLSSHQSLRTVCIISCLFMLDAFAGGFVMQSVVVGWFEKKFSLDTEWLGGMLSAMNVLSGLSSLAVVPLVARMGALNTAVFTHIPSNIVLLVVPFMEQAVVATGVLLLRYCLSQMDVPARQTFVVMMVKEEERSAAGGVTQLIRSLGVVLSPWFWGPLLDADPWKDPLWYGAPFLVAGSLKIVYDLCLYFSFTGH